MHSLIDINHTLRIKIFLLIDSTKEAILLIRQRRIQKCFLYGYLKNKPSNKLSKTVESFDIYTTFFPLRASTSKYKHFSRMGFQDLTTTTTGIKENFLFLLILFQLFTSNGLTVVHYKLSINVLVSTNAYLLSIQFF